MIITNKTEQEILNSEIEQLSTYERCVKQLMETNPSMSFKDAIQIVEKDFGPIDREIENIKAEFRNAIVKKYFFIFGIAVLTSVAIGLAFNACAYILSTDDAFFDNGVWIYYGIIALVLWRLFLMLKKKINFGYLLTQKIIFAAILICLSWIFDFRQNITSYNGNVIMMDDITYDDYGDEYGSSYSSNYELFLPLKAFSDGKFIKDDIEYVLKENEVELIKSEWNTYSLRYKKVLFWQFAYCEGYEPLYDTQNVQSKSFIYRITKVTPKYFLELLINMGVKGIAFALYILILVTWKEDKVTITA